MRHNAILTLSVRYTQLYDGIEWETFSSQRASTSVVCRWGVYKPRPNILIELFQALEDSVSK